MTTIFLQSFFLIFLAELGDKSQFLMAAMSAFCRKRDIFLGSIAAILTLNAMAILLGSAVGQYLPKHWISVISAIAFFAFSMMGMEDGKEEGGDTSHSKYAALSVFGTYFLAELGDKTQLATVALAAEHGNLFSASVAVFLGGSLGLFLSGLLGLLIGSVLGKRLPERIFSRVSSVLFFSCGAVRLLTGVEGLLQNTRHARLFAVLITILVSCLTLILILFGRSRHEKHHTSKEQSVSP